LQFLRCCDGVTFACLRRGARCLLCMRCRRLPSDGVTAGSLSNAVDLYNGASGTWSTAQLSVARSSLAATSVGNVAIFAGGSTGNCSSLTLFVEGLLVWADSCGRWFDVCVFEAWGSLFVVYELQEVAV
jgi:hypothetical protein